MPAMPYLVEVGPALSALTSYCNDGKNLENVLGKLRNTNNKLPDLLKAIGAPDDTVAHFATDWLGYQSTNPMTPQAPFDASNPDTTGWWTTWYGDAEGVLRQTMIRAIEVALGLSSGGDPKDSTRAWRMTFMWTCGAPMFQGWISWWDFDYAAKQAATNGNGNGNALADSAGLSTNGLVNVLISTPGNGHPLYATPFRHNGNNPPDYAVNPPTADGEYGLWVVGEEQMQTRAPDKKTWQNPGTGNIPDPWPSFFYTNGGVVTVSPAEEDGGVLHTGRHW